MDSSAIIHGIFKNAISQDLHNAQALRDHRETEARFTFKRKRLRFLRFSFTHATQAIAFEWKPGFSDIMITLSGSAA